MARHPGRLLRPQVTSTRGRCHEALCYQDDTSIGIARVDSKIRLTTLLNCSRAVRPERARAWELPGRWCDSRDPAHREAKSSSLRGAVAAPRREPCSSSGAHEIDPWPILRSAAR
jgi:hypothetical protein